MAEKESDSLYLRTIAGRAARRVARLALVKELPKLLNDQALLELDLADEAEVKGLQRASTGALIYISK